MIDFDALHKSVSNEKAQAVTSEPGLPSREHWWLEPPYTWESVFRPEYPFYTLRWAFQPDILPAGMKFDSKHKLYMTTSDKNPSTFYCKETFHSRDEDGNFPPEHECYFCEVMEYVAPLLEEIELQGRPDPKRFSGKDIVGLLRKMGVDRKVLIPMIVQAKKIPSAADDTFNDHYFEPSDKEEDKYGILICTRFNSSFYKGLRALHEQSGGKLSDHEEGYRFRLSRAPAGKGHKSVLTLDVNAAPLTDRERVIVKEMPDITTWGTKPPGPQSQRTCVDVNYVEAQHMFSKTLWADDLINVFTDPADW